MEDPLGLGWVLGGFSCVASVALSLAEGALSDFSWTKVETLARSKKVSEKIGKYLKREDDIALATSSLKVGANVLFVFAAVHLCLVHGASVTATYVIGAAALACVILVADVPAFMVGRRLAEPLLVRLFPTLDLVRFLLQPALYASRFVGEILARILGYPEKETQAESIADDLRSAATEGRHEGVLREEEEDMIEGILRFKEREISDVMTPRADMAVLPVETPLFDAAKFALEKGFSRIPVFRENSDDIVGVLHVRDILQYIDTACPAPPPLETIVRPPFFSPESKKVAELFQELRSQKVHMAIVLDEFGGTEGLITIEDILEEIVGEIEDEYDPEPEEPFRVIDDRTVMVDGRFRIDDLNDRFQVDIPENNGYDTVGGYLSFVFGHVPERGKVHEMDAVVFTVMDADPRKVRQVQIQKREEA